MTNFIRFFIVTCVLATGAHAVPLLDGFGGARNYGELAMLPNDDGSSNELNLPFDVDFFGMMYSTFYINNNGNVTFNGPVGTFTPNPFPVSNQPMIAPYWGDVDTRNSTMTSSNNVWVASPNAETIVVTWDDVGYYSTNVDKLNNFQLVLRDRSADTGNSGDFDVEFRYEMLQWTTGDASGGSGGLGGTPAQAGYDAGNGTDFFVLPGSRTADVLNLQNTSNVSMSTPGLWSFAIRSGSLPGETPDNPLLPVVTDEGWEFEFNVDLNQLVFIDPEVAIGYDYIVDAGPDFQTVLLPEVGDNSYDLYLWDGSAFVFDSVLTAGDEHDFGTGGVDRFRILGIEASAGLDPNDTTAFVTGLTFTDSGIVQMRMIPITTDTNGTVPAPEPSIIALLSLGLVSMGLIRRRKRCRS